MNTAEKNTPEIRFSGFESDWNNQKIGDLCDFIVPGRNKPKEFFGEIPWITTPDFDDEIIIKTSKSGLKVSKDEAKRIGSDVVPKGSVIISCVGELGLVAINGNEVVLNQQLHAFLPKERVLNIFILYALGLQKRYMEKVATKTTLLYMNKDNCNSIPINYPSLKEQQKIANFLTAIDQRITLLKQKKAALEHYKKGLMQKIFSQEVRFMDDDGKGYSDWEEKRLEEFADIKRGAGSQYITYLSCSTEGIRLIRIGDFLGSEPVYVENTRDIERFILKYGDILIAGTGATAGIVFEVPIQFDDLAYSYNAPRIRAIGVDTTFLVNYLKSPQLEKQKNRLLTGNAQPFLDIKDIKNLRLFIPDFEEQKKIANFFSAIDKKINAIDKQIANSELFKKGLLQKMFV